MEKLKEMAPHLSDDQIGQGTLASERQKRVLWENESIYYSLTLNKVPLI